MVRIAVLTLAIGEDYRKSLAKALESKRAYCEKHGYTYIELHEEVWCRERPIAWSKVPQWIKYTNTKEFDYIWISDADVYITNPELKLEEHVLPLLPGDKDMLLTYDSCGHVNTGNMIVRPCPWVTDFFKRLWEQEDCIYHIWWENAALTKLLGTVPSDVEHVAITTEAFRFNAYLQGLPGTRLWMPGDLLVHFAGVYDVKEMNSLIEEINSGRIPRRNMYTGERLEDEKVAR